MRGSATLCQVIWRARVGKDLDNNKGYLGSIIEFGVFVVAETICNFQQVYAANLDPSQLSFIFSLHLSPFSVRVAPNPIFLQISVN